MPTEPESGTGRFWWHEVGMPASIRQTLEVRLLHREESRFQRIEVFEHDFLGRLLVLDDVVQTTERDEYYYHEMLTHVPLLGAGVRERSEVLIIGGGDGGVLREVLLHPFVTRVDMVEIDERVIAVANEYLGMQGDYDDPRVRLVIGDAAEFVASPEVQARPYDVILVDATDPVGPGTVLYAPGFLADLRACLAPGGAAGRHLGVVEYQQEVFFEGRHRLEAAFASCEVYRAAVPTYTGGDMAFAVCVAATGVSAREPAIDHTGKYYNPDVHRGAFALPTWWWRRDAAEGKRCSTS